jgi:hypothetical protein
MVPGLVCHLPLPQSAWNREKFHTRWVSTELVSTPRLESKASHQAQTRSPCLWLLQQEGPGSNAGALCSHWKEISSGHHPRVCQDEGADLLGIQQQDINRAMLHWDHPAKPWLRSPGLLCWPGNWWLRPVLTSDPAAAPG